MIDLDELERLAKAAPAGKWEVWTSNSWRRVMASDGFDTARVIEPTIQHYDKQPDLRFGDGVVDWLENVTPETILALIAEMRTLRERWEDQLTLALMNCGVSAIGAKTIFDEMEAIDAVRGAEQNTTP